MFWGASRAKLSPSTCPIGPVQPAQAWARFSTMHHSDHTTTLTLERLLFASNFFSALQYCESLRTDLAVFYLSGEGRYSMLLVKSQSLGNISYQHEAKSWPRLLTSTVPRWLVRTGCLRMRGREHSHIRSYWLRYL